jgi:tetratricopeptide (TPR) repeat protein
MAVQGLNQRLQRVPASTVAFWAAACLAAALSLAAALVALANRDASSSLDVRASLEREARAREERIAFFEARAASDPLDFLSLNNLTGQYLQRARETGDVADYQRAELAAERSLAIIPGDNYGGITGLAAVRIAQHDFAAAEELARRALDLKPLGVAGYGLLGDALLNLGRYDEAATAYGRMLELEPALPALSRQADFAWVTGDLVNAEDYWRQALRFDDGLPTENRAWAMTQLGTLHFATGYLDTAGREYREALRLYPDYVHALAGLGAVRAAEAQWGDAIALYLQATQRLPEPRYVAALGDVYARAGRPAEAEEQYALVEVIDRLYRANGINSDLQLALFYADHDRRVDEALAMAESAYAVSPSIYAADVLAWALFKNGRAEEASVRIDEALRLGTADAAMHFHAARIKLALGDRAAARMHLERVQSLNPVFSPLHADEAASLLNGGLR